MDQQQGTQPVDILNTRIRDLESTMTSVSEKLITIEGQLKSFSQELEDSDGKMSGVNLDIKAAVTTIQNAMVSFGALKERVSMLSEAVGEMRELRDSVMGEVNKSHAERMASCQKLSDLRFANIEKQAQEALRTANSVSDTIRTELKSALESNERMIDSKLSYIHNGAYIVVGALALTLIKMVAAKLGIVL